MAKFLTISLLATFLFGVTPVNADGYILPVSGNFRVTQHPGGSYSHDEPATIEAWDLAGSGTPVSVADGTVLKVAFNEKGYGNYVTVRHHDGLVSLYAHLAFASVSPGQSISQGKQIGVIDSTGKSTGNHLHFSFFKNGKPYSSNGLIDFSSLNSGIITKAFDVIFPKLGGSPSEPLKPIDLKPISDIVTKLYNWALGVAATLALGIIIYAGVLRISSAGNPSRISESNEWIKAAIFGLIILLSAYLIFFTINPCIVGAGSGCA